MGFFRKLWSSLDLHTNTNFASWLMRSRKFCCAPPLWTNDDKWTDFDLSFSHFLFSACCFINIWSVHIESVKNKFGQIKFENSRKEQIQTRQNSSGVSWRTLDWSFLFFFLLLKTSICSTCNAVAYTIDSSTTVVIHIYFFFSFRRERLKRWKKKVEEEKKRKKNVFFSLLVNATRVTRNDLVREAKKKRSPWEV